MTTMLVQGWPGLVLPAPGVKPERKSLKKMRSVGELVAFCGRQTFLSRTGSVSEQIWSAKASEAWAQYNKHWEDLRKSFIWPERFRLHFKDAKTPEVIDRNKTSITFLSPDFKPAEANPFSWGGICLGQDRFIHVYDLVAIEILP